MPNDSSPPEAITTLSRTKTSSARVSSNGAGDLQAIHAVIASKGGIGKTTTACILAQALMARGNQVVCFDADPNNATLAQFAGLSAKPIPLYREGTAEIDIGALDALFESMLTEAATVVVDNGATGFQPFKDYLRRQEWIPEALEAAGRRLVLHTIVCGGPEILDTANGFKTLAEQMPPSYGLVVWENPHFGSLVGANGTHFNETPLMRQHRSRVSQIIELPRFDGYKRHSFELMVGRRMTFDEAVASDLTIADRQRLLQIKRDLFARIAEAV
jgi:CobQ/CobB/MinD/ParA nucleotide binding domain